MTILLGGKHVMVSMLRDSLILFGVELIEVTMSLHITGVPWLGKKSYQNSNMWHFSRNRANVLCIAA